ncbi:MAG: hypothetical protein E6F99_21445 [Actinobacteria bacterium]|nr:MAG: hypothetical protein E6F99_21445 [Actinomycetota bacterium]
MSVLRRVGLDGNPLRRPVDRAEAWLRLAVLALFVVAGPVLAWGTASRGYHDGAAAAERERAARHEIDAVLVTDAPLPSGDYAMVATPTVVADARWTGPDRSVHSGLLPAAAGAPAGSTVTLWTDRDGVPVTAPAQHDDLLARAGLAGGGTLLGLATVTGAALLVLRRMLDRYRLNAWQDAWSTVGPQWTDLI